MRRVLDDSELVGGPWARDPDPHLDDPPVLESSSPLRVQVHGYPSPLPEERRRGTGTRGRDMERTTGPPTDQATRRT